MSSIKKALEVRAASMVKVGNVWKITRSVNGKVVFEFSTNSRYAAFSMWKQTLNWKVWGV